MHKPMLLLCLGAGLAVASGLLSVIGTTSSEPEVETLITDGFASDSVVVRNDRRVALGPVADTETHIPVWIPEILEGFVVDISAQTFAAGAQLTPVAECAPMLPRRGARVAHGFAEGGQSGAGLYGMTSEERDEAAELFLLQIARHSEGRPSPPEMAPYLLNHVIVTETSAPVHIVLSSADERRIWRFHMAKGVEVTGVTILGGLAQATLGLPDDVPVEIMTSRMQQDCGITQIFAPVRAEDEPSPTFDRRVENYDLWFANTFGIGTLQGRSGLSGGWALVLGPLGDPLPMSADTNLRAVPGETLFGRGYAVWPDDFETDIIARATEAVGGDLSTIAGTRERQSVFDSFGN